MVTVVKPLTLGPYGVNPPIVLAPMAGITNRAFRRLCREQGAGAGLFVSEMVTARALIERNPKTLRMITFDPDEKPRSVQLYGVDPETVGRAVSMVVEGDLADHIDLNVGCPVPKVTRKGGGAALPYRRKVFARMVNAAVRAASGAVPVTVKMRLGIDEQHLTYRDAALAAQDAGVAAVALHARTAEQYYSGAARWDRIAELVQALDIPVLGNGDIWEADDAMRMMTETGCAGVVVGRGCLGRPWLFADLAAAFTGRPERLMPSLGDVATVMARHGRLLTSYLGEPGGVTDLRKHVAWYLKGFSVGSSLRRRLALASSLAELRAGLAELDADQPFPATAIGAPRGRVAPARRVALPDGWLADPDADAVPVGADQDGGSGG